MHTFVFFLKKKSRENQTWPKFRTTQLACLRQEKKSKKKGVECASHRLNTIQSKTRNSFPSAKAIGGARAIQAGWNCEFGRKLAGDALHQQKTITGDGINKLSANHETASAKNDEFGDRLNNQRIARSMRRAIRYPQPST